MSLERQTTTRMSVRTDRIGSADPLDPSLSSEAVFISTLNDIVTHEISGAEDASSLSLFDDTDAAGEGASAAKLPYVVTGNGVPGNGMLEASRLS